MNKKIRNATITKQKNITFKSQLEKSVYNTLQQLGFKPKYEPKTFTLIDAFEAKTPYYDKETDNQLKRRRELGDSSARKLVKKSNKFQGIRYTPDFYFKYNGIDIYIESKGFENDVFPIKKKLFLRYLNTIKTPSMYFEIYTKKQLLQAIEIIKEYATTSLDKNVTSGTS